MTPEVQEKVKACRTQFKVDNALLQKDEPFPKDKQCYFNCSGIAIGYLSLGGEPLMDEFIKITTDRKVPESIVNVSKKCFKETTEGNICEKGDKWRLCAIKTAKA